MMSLVMFGNGAKHQPIHLMALMYIQSMMISPARLLMSVITLLKGVVGCLLEMNRDMCRDMLLEDIFSSMQVFATS